MADPGKSQQGCCRSHPWCCGAALVLTAAVSVAVAVGLGVMYRPIRHKVEDLIESKVVLTENSPAMDNFLTSSAPLYTKYHFFNVKNPKAVEDGSERPTLEEVGPFIYRENRTKFDPKWNENETELEYKLNTTYTLDGKLDPKSFYITTVNLPLIGILTTIEAYENDPDHKYRELIEELIKLLDEAKKLFDWEGLFVTHTVEELLWGYDDPLLKFLYCFLPSFIPSYRFGLENRSKLEFPNRVYTGKGDLSLVAQYIEWNNLTHIDGWGTKTAGMINGTGGYQFHPGMTRDENITAFISQLYRSGYFSYERDASIYGIETYQFGLPMAELSNKSQDPGFYFDGPSGVLNLTAVYPQHVPIFASKPHFLDGDPGYVANVTGLHPNRSLHDSFLNVEPLTGAALRAAKRIQINLRMHPNSKLPDIENVKEVMLPVFWASEEGSLTLSLANEFKEEVYGVEYAIEGGAFAVIGLAGLTLVVCLMCLVGLVIQQQRGRGTRPLQRHHNDERAPLLTPASSGEEININL